MSSQDLTLDELDYRIILELQDVPRQSNMSLARRLGVSEATIRRRIEHLISSGTINLTAVPNPFKLGYQVVAFIGLHVQLDEIDNIGKRLVEIPDIHYVGLCSGNYDYLIWGFFATHESLSNFIINKLGQIPGVMKTETMIQLRYLKRTLGCIGLSAIETNIDVPALRKIGQSGKSVLQKTGTRFRKDN